MANMGQLVVNLEANIAKFTSDMGKASQATEQAMGRINGVVDTVKNGLATLGIGASIGGFALIVKGAIDAADNLRDMSQKTGIAVEELNGLGFASGQAGGSLEAMASAASRSLKPPTVTANRQRLSRRWASRLRTRRATLKRPTWSWPRWRISLPSIGMARKKQRSHCAFSARRAPK